MADSAPRPGANVITETHVQQIAAAFAEADVERSACAVCGKLTVRDFPAGSYHLNLLPPLGVVECLSCGTLFMSPRPSHALRSELMAGRVPDLLRPYSSTTANYSAVTEGRAKVFQNRLDELARLTEHPSGTPLRFLDVGASSGVMVGHARARGWEAHGVEPSVEGARAAFLGGVQMPRGLAESLPFASSAFDLVHSHHVFEHLADPLTAAKEIHRVLKPGGIVFIEVPNQLANIMFRRDLALGRVPQRERNIRSIHHLWFFSRRTLPMLLMKAGFRDVQTKDLYTWKARGLRAPFTLLTRFAGVFAWGGPLIQAHGRKPAN